MACGVFPPINRVRPSAIGPHPSPLRKGKMMRRIKRWVEDGRFEEQLDGLFKSLERPVRAFVWFAAGFATFMFVLVIQAENERAQIMRVPTGTVVTDSEFHKRLKYHGLDKTGSVVFEDWQGNQWFIRDGQKISF